MGLLLRLAYPFLAVKADVGGEGLVLVSKQGEHGRAVECRLIRNKVIARELAPALAKTNSSRPQFNSSDAVAPDNLAICYAGEL